MIQDRIKKIEEIQHSVEMRKQGFSYGKFYYEVQVKGKTEWDLGVASESINRKEMTTLTPVNGFWTLILRNDNEYDACENPSVSFSLKVKPEKVGVFVDYEEGLVSFYDVGSSSHIYSFTVESAGLDTDRCADEPKQNGEYSREPALSRGEKGLKWAQKFAGDEAVGEGVKRHVLSMVMQKLKTGFAFNLGSAITALFEGEKNHRVPSASAVLRDSNLFRIAGRMIGHSFLHGGPCLSGLSLPVVVLLTGGNADSAASALTLRDCPDLDHRETISLLRKTQLTGEEMTRVTELCLFWDIPVPSLRNRDWLFQQLLSHAVLGRVKCQIKDLRKGIKDTGIWPLLSQRPDSHRIIFPRESVRDITSQNHLVHTQTDMQQMIQNGMKKIQAIQHSEEKRKMYSSLYSLSYTKNWTEIRTDSDVDVFTLKRALTLLKEQLNEKLSQTGLKWAQEFAGGGEQQHELSIIPTDSDGYSTRLLKLESNNGKIMLFVVPLQEQLSTEPLPFDSVEFAKMPQSNCMKCGRKIPLSLLPLHIKECEEPETESATDVTLLDYEDENVNESTDWPSSLHTVLEPPSELRKTQLTEEEMTRVTELCLFWDLPVPSLRNRDWLFQQLLSHAVLGRVKCQIKDLRKGIKDTGIWPLLSQRPDSHRIVFPRESVRDIVSQSQLVQIQTDVQQMIQDRMKKIQEIQHSVELRKNQLVQTQTDVQQMIQNRIKKIKEIQHSVDMKKMFSSLCSRPHTKIWTEISINSDVNVYTMHRALTHLKKAHETLNKKLSQTEAVEVVGVFVDYEEGLVSFYDVGSSSHIYTFTGQTFTDKLYPFFFPVQQFDMFIGVCSIFCSPALQSEPRDAVETHSSDFVLTSSQTVHISNWMNIGLFILLVAIQFILPKQYTDSTEPQSCSDDSRITKNQLVQTQTDVQQMIQNRIEKIEELQHSGELKKTQTDVQQMIQNRMKKIQEIQHSVEKRKTFSSLYSRPHKNWTEISIDSDVNVLPMNRALTLVKKTHETLSKKLSQTALKFVQKFADGYWTVIVKNENHYIVFDNPIVLFPQRGKPKIVGVFVDYEEGLVSFYDVGHRSHIYSFTGQTFTDKLYPYFSPGLNEEESSGSDTDRGAADNPEQNEEDSGDPALSRDEKERLKTVGVFVDYEEGLVSFYDVGSRSHIYSFTGQTFTNKLYPYFFPETPTMKSGLSNGS
ncbi:G2 M phase-specific E3 ubiquitin- ligase-like protein [Labeo rohita]|uniref:G2 M phase-specific E3 ubiquitin-ligase-like protein n=1 Tax=Labeo rohita TaxID=84645 RepID=A0A498LWY7_LABRO|nr:G2 M phase-specific E3 ubiquitin- ligase-like protein [Labeo rohita]